YCCIFFFQAEDGIRDFHVTGVQTCALPIYRNWQALQKEFCIVGEPPHPARQTRTIGIRRRANVARRAGMHMEPSPLTSVGIAKRSEERRVGKECRTRREMYP